MGILTLCLIQCFVLAITISYTRSNSTVEYYLNLINSEIERSQTFPLPENAYEFKPNSTNTQEYGTFDYIIVGAGSAGAVIANRLSEIPDNKILLLDAGGNGTDFTDIPAMSNYLYSLEFNWNYITIPQNTTCLGMQNQECAFPRGKALGGSSTINVLHYIRGNKEDFDSWVWQGNPGWSYEDVLPYFIKSENSHINGDEGYHGKGGYLNVQHYDYQSPVAKAFIEGNLQLGRKFVDYNGKQQLGVARTQFTKNGRRDSTGRAFLDTVVNRSNLKILSHGFVTKILIKQKRKIAYGVLFSYQGKIFTAKAKKEIILSAGTVGSAQLLMLSGIGPKEHLHDLGIPVLQPLAVGQNLQDHPFYGPLFFTTNYTESMVPLESKIEEYLQNKTGPLTAATNDQAIGFFQTKLANISSGLPDIEIVMAPPQILDTNNKLTGSMLDFIKQTFRYTEETYNSIWTKADGSNILSMMALVLHPKSRGEIKLKSKDPYEYPLIDTRGLSDSDNKDIETLYEAIQLALEIIDTEPLKKYNVSFVNPTLPVCKEHEYLSKNYWYCQIRQLSSHLFHAVGTCKMGPNPQNGDVVNHELKVYGIKKLRVADASIMPDIISAHTNAATIMIGEKISDMIKRENE